MGIDWQAVGQGVALFFMGVAAAIGTLKQLASRKANESGKSEPKLLPPISNTTIKASDSHVQDPREVAANLMFSSSLEALRLAADAVSRAEYQMRGIKDEVTDNIASIGSQIEKLEQQIDELRGTSNRLETTVTQIVSWFRRQQQRTEAQNKN